MIRRLLFGYLAVTALVLLTLELPLATVFADHERDALVADVRRDADAVARFATAALAGGDPRSLQPVADAYRRRTGGRLVVVDAAGRSVADSADRVGRDFSTRPEFRSALQGDPDTGFRPSETLDERLLYVAVPVDPGGQVVGAVRVTYAADVVDERIRRTWLVLGGIALLALLGAALLGWWLARSFTRPVREVERAARRLGAGDLSARAPVPAGPDELRRLAEEVNDAGARIQQLVDVQGALLADVSHQLRTPLTAVRLRLEVLEGAVPAEAARDVDAALHELQRLSAIVEGLLHAARSEQRGAGDAQALDLGAIVADRRDAWTPVARDADVTLVARGVGQVTVLATPGHLEQVLDNLVANAIEASPAGGRVWFEVRSAADGAELHVIDEGPGMDADRRTRAFDRFSPRRTPDGSSRPGGFGLGLSIAQRLVAADGGRLELLEAPGGGLDVRIRLRTAPPAASAPDRP